MAPKQVRVAEAVEDFQTYREARLAKTTVNNQGFVLRRFVAFLQRDIQLRHLTADHVEDFFYGPNGVMRPHTTRDGHKRDPVEPSTHNYYRKTLDTFFEYWRRRGVIKVDLLMGVGPMKLPRKDRLQPSAEQLLAMIRSAANQRDRALLSAAANTGLRRASILRIVVGDVDLQNQSIKVRISKTHDVDDVPITSDLAGDLTAWLRRYAIDLGRPLRPDDVLFPAQTGNRYEWVVGSDGKKTKVNAPSSWIPTKALTHPERIVHDALRRVGLPTVGEGMHTIRRAAARLFFDHRVLERGHDGALRVASAFLHHKDSKTTEGYLGLSSERAVRDTALKGNRFLTLDTKEAQVIDVDFNATA